MKTENWYHWMTLWNGKMSKTRYLATEEFIRKTHPEAVCVEGSLVVRQIPETDAERTQALVDADTNYIGGVRRRADGSVLKYGEQP